MKKQSPTEGKIIFKERMYVKYIT